MSGLNALHEHGILHLDIKPENLLYDNDSEDSKILLTDFGLSKLLANMSEREKVGPSMEQLDAAFTEFEEAGHLPKLRGTLGYMAPELILCGHNSKAADVFAAGMCNYI